MQLPSVLYPAILTILSLSPTSIKAAKVPKDAILLSQVRSLTLRNNAQTSHRRVAAVPQLSCTGPGCRHHEVDVMRCTNTGSSYGSEEIEWSCTAEMPEEFKLGSTDVQCEGYSSRDDPYVLKGSCGVEYRLLLTSKGEEKYGKGTPGYKPPSNKTPSEGWEAGSILFMILFVGVLFWIIYSACTALPTNPNAAPRAPRRNNGGWGGGGGGGGWGGWGGGNDDPPPPYPGTGSKPSGSQDSWRPGFWTGAGLGAGAGYLAGRGRGNQNRERESLFGNGRQDNGGWFGGRNNNNGGYTQPSRSNSNGSSSSARHESTGFGSTSRR